MKKNKLFENRKSNISKTSKEFIDTSFYIADKINDTLNRKGILIKDFSKMIGESEEDINTWMTGIYDFPISTIIKIEKCLGISIIKID